MYAKFQYTAPLYMWLVYVNKDMIQLHIPRYSSSNLIWNYKYPFSVTFANKIYLYMYKKITNTWQKKIIILVRQFTRHDGSVSTFFRFDELKPIWTNSKVIFYFRIQFAWRSPVDSNSSIIWKSQTKPTALLRNKFS